MVAAQLPGWVSDGVESVDGSDAGELQVKSVNFQIDEISGHSDDSLSSCRGRLREPVDSLSSSEQGPE